MPDYYELRPDYGRRHKHIPLEIEPFEKYLMNVNNPRIKMSFDDDLFDGFVDTRLYSSLNGGSRQGLEKQECFYNRNIIAAPAANLNRSCLSRHTVPTGTTTTKRRRTLRSIRNKVYYPASDSDSEASEGEPIKTDPANPFSQRVPVYVYEEYNKKNKYLPKASRRVYKCKKPPCCQEPPPCCKPTDYEVKVEKIEDVPTTEIVYTDNPRPSTARTSLSLATQNVQECRTPSSTRSPTPTPSPIQATIPLSDPCPENKCCRDVKSKLSDIERALREYYESQKKLEMKEMNEERELKTVDMKNSKSSKCTKSSCCAKRRSRNKPLKDKSRSKEKPISSVSRESASSRVPTYHPSAHTSSGNERPLTCKDVCQPEQKRSKGKNLSHASSRSRLRSGSEKSRKSSTHKCLSTSCQTSEHKQKRRNLTTQRNDPIEIACDCLRLGGTEPRVCYESGSTPNKSGTTPYSSPQNTSRYYTGTATRTGTGTGTGTDRRVYSGSNYFSGTKSSKGPSGGKGEGGGPPMSKYLCDPHTCGFGNKPIDVGYATTIVTRFSTYTVYEVLRPSIKRPPSICRVTENVFVVKNKFRL